jgi:hypothetical protein
MRRRQEMKNLLLILGTAFFAFSWVAGLVFVDDLLSAPTVSQTDKGFKTDRLLEQDIYKGAAPLGNRDRDRDRDRDKKPEERGKQRLDHANLDGRELND